MKNLSNLLVVISILVFFSLGCSSLPNMSSGNSEPIPPTGIPECDKLFAKIEEKVSEKNKETSFIERTAYGLIKDQVAKAIRDGMSNTNASDKKEIAAKCTEAMQKMDEVDGNSNSSTNNNSNKK